MARSETIPMRVGAPPISSEDPGGASVFYKTAITVVLAFLYAAQSIAVTYSKDGDTFSYDPNTAVMSTELLKLFLASSLFYRAISNARAGSGEPPGYALEGRVIVRFAIPALIYMMGNNVMFLALRYLDAPTYQVLGNTKIIVVAVIQRMALGSRKTVVQWLGVGLLMLGMMVIGASKFDATAGTGGNENLLAGVFWMFVIALCSALAGVYTEFLLKKLSYSTDFQNMLLYSWGVVFCLLGNSTGTLGNREASAGGYFGGFSWRTWLVVVINAFLGQVVSRVMKYADNITKVFAASSGVVITMLVSVYMFDFSLSLLFNLGTGVVVIASVVYFSPEALLTQKL